MLAFFRLHAAILRLREAEVEVGDTEVILVEATEVALPDVAGGGVEAVGVVEPRAPNPKPDLSTGPPREWVDVSGSLRRSGRR